jgi:hypothetical protein
MIEFVSILFLIFDFKHIWLQYIFIEFGKNGIL